MAEVSHRWEDLLASGIPSLHNLRIFIEALGPFSPATFRDRDISATLHRLIDLSDSYHGEAEGFLRHWHQVVQLILDYVTDLSCRMRILNRAQLSLIHI